LHEIVNQAAGTSSFGLRFALRLPPRFAGFRFATLPALPAGFLALFVLPFLAAIFAS
jgi:hypothetical protein